ncbi:MAG: GNAT family N-acetyltransferase [Desulfobacterales bacterium]
MTEIRPGNDLVFRTLFSGIPLRMTAGNYGKSPKRPESWFEFGLSLSDYVPPFRQDQSCGGAAGPGGGLCDRLYSAGICGHDFVWQVAVDASERGRGLGVQLLTRVFENARACGVKNLDATITPSNKASIGLFTAVARALKARFVFEEEFFSVADFGKTTHEAEVLFHIGPISDK